MVCPVRASEALKVKVKAWDWRGMNRTFELDVTTEPRGWSKSSQDLMGDER